MPELQEQYRSIVDVAFREMKDAEARYHDAVRNYLCSKLTDKEVLEYIGDAFLYALMEVYAYNTSNYVICESGYDYGDVQIGFDEIIEIVEDLASMHNLNTPELEQLKKILEIFYGEITAYDVTNMSGGGMSAGNTFIDIADYETEYHDEWSYSENYEFNMQYKEFYGRVKQLLEKHFPSIVEDVMSGRYSGLVDIISVDYRISELYEKLDLGGKTKWDFVKEPENRKKLIKEYILSYIAEECKQEVM